MSGANPSSKKRRNKGKDSPGPDQDVISWKEEEFQNLVREMGFLPEWGAQFPTPNSTALDAPSESEIDLGVFTATHGNLLENFFEASSSGGTRFSRLCEAG
ncbi:hypothetical protein HanPI659440_Chr07g0259181 [Helianthus annuus]|nr:hypothetical protein HanPI659440_Chr07g0259181 [Helianthus annuus]KAJ0904288.1 hypothetical protein HanPSC8_Chr07g0280371 [Helianthus annuus]